MYYSGKKFSVTPNYGNLLTIGMYEIYRLIYVLNFINEIIVHISIAKIDIIIIRNAVDVILPSHSLNFQ